MSIDTMRGVLSMFTSEGAKEKGKSWSAQKCKILCIYAWNRADTKFTLRNVILIGQNMSSVYTCACYVQAKQQKELVCRDEWCVFQRHNGISGYGAGCMRPACLNYQWRCGYWYSALIFACSLILTFIIHMLISLHYFLAGEEGQKSKKEWNELAKRRVG